ncbi:MAG: glycerol-3-phosphate 1-O-acyltransferase PlsY [Firmicutes bacterium]|nr:glycerol-3-phosphate 1-O-acyltransferase PlsY [Bacillota bacterium]
MMNSLLHLLLAYFLGAIPFGYLLPKLVTGKDVREYGSGNIGFTNVLRTFGPKLGIPVLIGDLAKGYLAVKLVQLTASWTYLPLVAAVVVALGHNYTLFLGFKGGRGIATSAGAILALMPEVVGLLLLIWATMLFLFRYVSLASITAALSFPVLVAVLGYSLPYIAFALLLGLLAVYRHRPNIQRLLAGKELKLGQKGEKRNAK